MSPRFSIIIPVYNVAPYLRECLDSVLAQTFTNWEAICVDDGSTDGSGTILDEYETRDGRIRVIHQVNGGVSRARNAALEIAQGEYLVYLDADDLFASKYLEDVDKVVRDQNHPDLIRLKGFVLMNEDGDCRPCEIRKISCADPLAFLCEALIADAALCLNVFRRNVISDVRFPLSVRYGEDDVYVMRQMGKISSFYASDIQGYVYRYQRAGAASRTLTCADMAVLFDHLRENILKFLEVGYSRPLLISFYCAYLNKNIHRVILRKARVGAAEMRRSILKCRSDLGVFETEWNVIDRIWLGVYLKCGSFVVCDIVSTFRRIWSKISRVLKLCVIKWR